MPPTHTVDLVCEFFRAGDHMSATTERNGKIVGFSESEGRGRVASGDVDNSETVTITLVGSSPRGEEGTIQACQRLVAHLNTQGESWGEPREVDAQHIDGIADGIDASVGETLKIQVVRALTRPSFWQSLGHSGNVTLTCSLSECADILKKAIEHKISKIPLEIRAGLALVLDANDIPGLFVDSVVQEFIACHSDWARAQGFRSIWLVGSWKVMVKQLG